MSDQQNPSRRKFLSLSAGVAAVIMASRESLAADCSPTPAQIKGPFYPVSLPEEDSINDLTFIEGRRKGDVAAGEVVYITGTVLDAACKPVKGALVEIWQAAASGRYDHPADTSGLKLDPNFQGWGEYITGDDGRYVFKTIVPGHYPADEDWIRPPHVHFKVTRRGFHELITQMYFAATSFSGSKATEVERLNRNDSILASLTRPDKVTVEFTATAAPRGLGDLLAYRKQGGMPQLTKVGTLSAAAGEKVGTFDLYLRSVR